MQITDRARDMLKQVLQEKNASGIRLHFSGYGWGGPQIGLALDEPAAEDQVSTINDIVVAIDKEIIDFTQNLTLEYDEAHNGIVLLGNDHYC